MDDEAIARFIRDFEEGTLPRSAWTHERHLLMALWYLCHHDRNAATDLIRSGIQKFNARQGNLTGYHETITLAWVAVIDHFLQGKKHAKPISVLFQDLLSEHGARDALLRHYSRERLFSDEARHGWLLPDLAGFEGPD